LFVTPDVEKGKREMSHRTHAGSSPSSVNGSPTVANAIETFKVRDDTQGFLGMDVPCHTPEFGVMVGYAVTATANSMAPGRAGTGAAFEASGGGGRPAQRPGDQEVGPKPTLLFPGRRRPTITKRLGAIGIVTNGGVRTSKVKPLGTTSSPPVSWSRTARSTSRRSAFRRDQRTIVKSGDLIHGDASGVTTIPLEIADRLYAECLKVRERETALRDFATGRDFTLEALRQRLLGK
jgi:hypothetical protein